MADSRAGRKIAIGGAAAVVSAAVLVWAPAVVDFAFAVLAAVAWCLWLEERPTLDIDGPPRHDRSTRFPVRH